jgi:hypothetical protein
VGSKVASRKAPASYTKIVIKGMTRAEMTLKVVMSPSEPINSFVEQFNKLIVEADIVEFTRVLDMKGIRKVDQSAFIDYFNTIQPTLDQTSIDNLKSNNQDDGEESRIKKLEKLIKKRL